MTTGIKLAAGALAAAILVVACGGSSAQAQYGDVPVIDVRNPVERFFRYDLTGYGVDEVASQCDNHGHRVFSSSSGRGDGDFQVVDDPSCPGGKPR